MITENDLPKKYRRPKLMLVGDSLAQGCRTLTVKQELCAQSYGAVLAATQGWAHTPAQHPQPVIADVEDLIRRSNNLTTYLKVAKKINQNIQAWQATFAKAPTGTPLCFDNVAIAASDINEISGHTSAHYTADYDNHLGQYTNAQSLIKKLGTAASLHLPINGRYTLNPTGDTAFKDLSQLDWAFIRKPQHLIAHFGHNNGIYNIGGFGQVPSGNGLLDMKKAYLDVVKKLLNAPKEIEHIILILLPKISCVANLKPEGGLIPGTDYHQSYKTTFPFGDTAISGKDMARLDSQIKEINGEARMLASAAMSTRRITIVDGYQLFAKYDYKNTLNPGAQLRIGSALPIDNRYLKGRLLPAPVTGAKSNTTPGSPKYTFAHGGFQSLDGMHLSAVGYAVMADQIALEMGLPRNTATILKTALKQEKLITDFPSALQGFHNLLNLVKSLIDLLSQNNDPTAAQDNDLKSSKAAPFIVAAIARKHTR